MVHFINTKTGTKRNPDGSLEATAGRLEILDTGTLLVFLSNETKFTKIFVSKSFLYYGTSYMSFLSFFL